MTAGVHDKTPGTDEAQSRLPRAWLDAALVGSFLPIVALIPALAATGGDVIGAAVRGDPALLPLTVAALVALPCLGAFLADALQDPGLSARARMGWAAALFVAAPVSSAVSWRIHVRPRARGRFPAGARGRRKATRPDRTGPLCGPRNRKEWTMSEDRDPSVERETAAAEREAGEIGGRRRAEDSDDAVRSVREAGGGEAEGFEDAEEALRDHAEHADPGGNPLEDRPPPEPDRDAAAHGEADRLDSTETETDTSGR